MVQYLPAADVFRALAHPTRLAIIDNLAAGDAALTDLARPFDMSLTAVQKHVAILQKAGLVQCRKEGRVRRCRLDPRPLDELSAWADERRRIWERRLDALAAVVEISADRPQQGPEPQKHAEG